MEGPELKNKKVLHSFMSVLMITTVSLLVSSCMAGNYLKTEGVKPAEVQGTFTLFLYGCRYPNDIDNAVILARDGGRYTFALFAPEFEYKMKYGLPAEEALKEAEKFLRCSFYYRQSQLRRIIGPEGNTIGYELRPLYAPYEFGMSDVHMITYTLKNDRVRVTIRLDPDVERNLFGPGDQSHEREEK